VLMLGFASAIILKYMALAVTQQQPEINVIFTSPKNLTTKKNQQQPISNGYNNSNAAAARNNCDIYFPKNLTTHNNNKSQPTTSNTSPIHR
jgi:hypothetical protein